MRFIDQEDVPEQYKEQVQHAQILYVYETIPVQVVSNIIAGIFIVYVLIDYNSLALVTSWYLPYCLILLERLWVWRRFNRATSEEKNNPKWGNYLYWNVVIFAVSWVYYFQIFYDQNLPQYNAFLIVVVAGVTAGGFSSLSAYVKTFISFSLIALVPITIRLFIEGGKLNVSLGVLSILFTGVLIIFARKAHRHYRLAVVSRLKYRDINEELKQQQKRAERSDAAKSRFLSTLSHDVRQPLHALHLFIHTLTKTNKDNALKDIIKNISKTSNSVRWFFNQLLDYSRVESRLIAPKYNVFALSDLLDKLFIEYEMFALEKGIKLHIVPTSVIVETDPHFLERILRNLLSNAIRYTNKGKVLIGCRRRKRSIQIMVLDTGSGIPDKNIRKIFDEYYQGSKSENISNKGTGLGLSIASGLADLMNTEIKLKSVEGKGSCFSVDIPRIRSINKSENDQDEDMTDISLLQAKINLYFDHNTDQEIIDAVRLWSPGGLITTQIELIHRMVASKSPKPDVVIFDENVFNEAYSLETILQEFHHCRDDTPIIILSNRTVDKKNKIEKTLSHINWVKKPVRPAMLRLLIEQVIK